MFQYINQKIALLRQRGASGRLDRERRQLAQAYRELELAAKRQCRQDFRDQQVVAIEAAQQDRLTAAGVLADDACVHDSHWGMGTAHFPISAFAWDRTCSECPAGHGSRGGSRPVADEMLPEL
jgi:hypothetical protein